MPNVKPNSNTKFLYENISFGAKEAFRRLRTNTVTVLGENEECRIIGVTSSHPGEGKSLVSLNLAFSFAEQGRKVLVVDGDMFRPSLHTKLNMEPKVGLAELLDGNNDLSAAIINYRSSDDKLSVDVILSASPSENETELLTSKRMESMLNTLRKAYDYIVIDFPPVGSVADVAAVSKRVDGMLVVVHEGHCPQSALRATVEQLSFSGANILGFVVNGSSSGSKGYGYSKYGYGGYGYGYSYKK